MLLQLDIQLLDCSEPAIWRKLLVPSHFTFHKLHRVIQIAFGWNNSHLYEFVEQPVNSELIITLPEYSADRDMLHSKTVRLAQYLSAAGDVLYYIYDYGDDWKHCIRVEEVFKDDPVVANIIGGEGKTPPEDIGGPHGFIAFKKAVNDPAHEEYYEYREWLKLKDLEVWNRYEFNLPEVQHRLIRI